MRMSITTRIALGFVVVALLIGVVGLYGLNATIRVVEAFKSGDQHYDTIVVAATEVSSYAKRAEGHVMLFLSLGDKDNREKFFLRDTSLLEQMKILDGTVDIPEARTILDKIKPLADEMLISGNSLLKAYDDDVARTGIFDFQKHRELVLEFTNTTATIRNYAVELSEFELASHTESVKAATQTASTIQRNATLVMAAVFILALGLSHVFAKFTLKPLAQLKAGVIKITEGNMETRISIGSNDEIGDLANRFNYMAEQVNKRDKELKIEITGRKRVEETLREINQDLESAQRLTRIGNWKWVIATNKVTWSKELYQINGWDSNLPALPFAEMGRFYTPESWERLNEVVTKAFNTGESFEIELEQIPADGTKLITLSRGEADLDSSGKIVGLRGTVQDITERKKLQEQLIAQDRLVSIGQLVSGVAHELNNPLTSVIGFSDLLLQGEVPNDIKADLKIINEEAKRTALIVRNLLSFARQQVQEKRAIGINEPIQIVLQLRSHEQNANNIKVNTHLAPDLTQIMGNGSQLQQVFFNIVTNAEQSMLEAHKKGTLTITTKQMGNVVQASFADDGPGISHQNMARLFSPFFTTKDIGKGTGLGLSICQGIITEHGGRMYAKSEPGKGATFIVELPVSKITNTPKEAK